VPAVQAAGTSIHQSPIHVESDIGVHQPGEEHDAAQVGAAKVGGISLPEDLRQQVCGHIDDIRVFGTLQHLHGQSTK
jgi:hypothetical protein